MKHGFTLRPEASHDMRICAKRYVGRLGRKAAHLVLLAALLPRPAAAVDGCLVLLCFAAPSWGAIAQCVAPIKQVLHDLALGKPFPTCGMSGGGNDAQHAWSQAPGFCPPQYTIVWEGESGPIYACSYDGAVQVTINGLPFARTWWSLRGNTVTDFSAEAKAQLGSWDARFDDDYAAWLAAQPPAPPPPPCHDC